MKSQLSPEETAKITTIIFDVDDTLYDVGTGFTAHRNGDAVFSFMVAKLNFPDKAAAKKVRDEYFRRYHSTAKGLTVAEEEGKIPKSDNDTNHLKKDGKLFHPQDLSNWWAENLDFSLLGGPYTELAQVLSSCNLNLVAFSNGPRTYVLKLLKEIGLDTVFPDDKVFAVDDVLPSCKPEKEAFEKIFDKIGVKDPSECIMVEDSMKNTQAAKALGMTTVLISGLQSSSAATAAEADKAGKAGDAPNQDDPAVDVCVETVIEIQNALPGLFPDSSSIKN